MSNNYFMNKDVYAMPRDMVAVAAKSLANVPEEDLTLGINRYLYDNPEFAKLKTSRERLDYLLENPEALEAVASQAFDKPLKDKLAQESGDKQKVLANDLEFRKYEQDLMDLAEKKRNRIQNDADNAVQTAKDDSGMPTLTNSEFLEYANTGNPPARYSTSESTDKYLAAAPDSSLRINPSDSLQLMRNRLSPLDIMRNRLANERYAEEHPVLDKVARAGELIGSALNIPYVNDLGKARDEGTLRRSTGELMNPVESPKLLGSEALDIPLAAINVGGVTSFGKAPVARALGNDSYQTLLKANFPETSLAYPNITVNQIPNALATKLQSVLDPSSSVGFKNGVADKVVTAGRNFTYGAAPALKEDLVSDESKKPSDVMGDVLGAGISSSLLGYGARRLGSGAQLTKDMQDYVNRKINLGKAEALSDLAQTGDINQPSVKSYLDVLDAQRKAEGFPPLDRKNVGLDLRFSEGQQNFPENYNSENGFLSGVGQSPNSDMQIPLPQNVESDLLPNEVVTPGYTPGYSDKLLNRYGLNRKNQYVDELGQTNPDDAQFTPSYTSEFFGHDKRDIPKILNLYKDVPSAVRGYAGEPTGVSDSPYIFGRDLQKGSSFYEVPTAKNDIPITDLKNAEDILKQKGVDPTEAQKQQLIYMANLPPEKAATVKSLGDDYLQAKAFENPSWFYDRSLNARLEAASKPTLGNQTESVAWLLGKGYQPTKEENELPESQKDDLASYFYTSRYSPDFLRRLAKPSYVRIKESEE